MPMSTNKGTSKLDAISVENYRIRGKTKIDFSTNDDTSLFKEDLIILDSFPKTLKRTRAESSYRKSDAKFGTFMCEICADEKSSKQKFRILGCNHSYCSDCMRNYVASKLQENITRITCPVPACNGFLEPQHCHSILPKQMFDRWGDALCEAVILGSEKFYCPYKDCSSLLIDEKIPNNVMMESECPDCHRLFCVQCKVPWHSEITCVEFQKLNKDERSNEDIMLKNLAKSKKWARCPKCKIFVEKISGCSRMSCRCGNRFDYNGFDYNSRTPY